MNEIQSFDIRSHVIESIIEAYDTMLSMKVEFSEEQPPERSGVNRIVAAVNFAGNVVGIFNIQVTTEFARAMTASMLEMDPEAVESDEETKDLLAEISNIIGGNLKSALNDAGFPCIISTPSITYGTDFTIKSLNMQRFERMAFRHQQDLIVVEVGVKMQQASAEDAEAIAADLAHEPKQIDVEKLNALDLKAKISGSVLEIFDTMLFMELEETDSVMSSSLEGIRNVGSVSFAGDVTGMVNIQVSEELSRIMVANMLGIEADEIEGEEEIKDLLGELGNIVGGNLKSAFTDIGLSCALSTPSFTTGTDFKIESLNMAQYERFAFRYGEHAVFVEMGIKISELLELAAKSGKEIHYSVDVDPIEPVGTEEAVENANTAADAEVQPDATHDTPARPAPEPEAPPVTAAAATPQEATQADESKPGEDVDLDLLLDIPLDVTVEIGRTRIQIRDLLELNPASLVTLTKLEGDPVDILANDTLIARGEVVVQKEKYGIRVTEITSRMDRIRSFN